MMWERAARVMNVLRITAERAADTAERAAHALVVRRSAAVHAAVGWMTAGS